MSQSPKARYRIRNWREYNAALVNRGSLTLWISPEVEEEWRNPEKSGQRGRPQVYSDMAIQCLLTLKAVYRLPLRALEGLALSLMGLMRLDLPVPDYSTLSRRQQTLSVILRSRLPQGPLDIVVDSTGVKVFGEGEWKVRQYGASKRRQWLKVHLAIDAKTQEVVAALITPSNTGDNTVAQELLAQIDGEVASFAGDGAYDTEEVHQALLERGIEPLIPPRENAVPWGPLPDGTPHPRTAILEQIAAKGRKGWKNDSGYHRRSLAETGMFRYKQLFGNRFSARHPASQQVEGYIRVDALNRMSRIGMPESYRVPA